MDLANASNAAKILKESGISPDCYKHIKTRQGEIIPLMNEEGRVQSTGKCSSLTDHQLVEDGASVRSGVDSINYFNGMTRDLNANSSCSAVQACLNGAHVSILSADKSTVSTTPSGYLSIGKSVCGNFLTSTDCNANIGCTWGVSQTACVASITDCSDNSTSFSCIGSYCGWDNKASPKCFVPDDIHCAAITSPSALTCSAAGCRSYVTGTCTIPSGTTPAPDANCGVASVCTATVASGGCGGTGHVPFTGSTLSYCSLI